MITLSSFYCTFTTNQITSNQISYIFVMATFLSCFHFSRLDWLLIIYRESHAANISSVFLDYKYCFIRKYVFIVFSVWMNKTSFYNLCLVSHFLANYHLTYETSLKCLFVLMLDTKNCLLFNNFFKFNTSKKIFLLLRPSFLFWGLLFWGQNVWVDVFALNHVHIVTPREPYLLQRGCQA